jgi:hypothetical protein
MGLNVMPHQLEDLYIAQGAAEKNEAHEDPSQSEIDRVVEDLLRDSNEPEEGRP